MSRPWYPRYHSDYSAKTGHLSLMEHGAYALLLDYYFSTGGPIPAHAVQMHRICKAVAPEEQAAVQSVIEQFFVLHGGAYHNDRADKELKKASGISEKRRAAQAERERQRHAREAALAGASDGANAPTTTTTTTVEEASGEASLSARAKRFVLPDWVPPDDWRDFIEMRTRKRNAPTDRAKELIVLDLAKLREQGHDPAAVLQQSIRRGWAGVFEIKPDRGNHDQRTNDRKPAARHGDFAKQDYRAGTDGFEVV